MSMPVFELDCYQAERLAQPGFTMVEIGHDTLPVAYQQPRSFTDGRAYIGIEAWLRGYGNSRQLMLQNQHEQRANGQNIFYITQSPGGKVLHEGEDSWYEGDFDPTTLLPNEAVDEVFISNVLTDPFMAGTKNSVELLIAEAARLLRPGGCLIIRETITPEYKFQLKELLFESHGLQVVDYLTPSDRAEWDKLEAVFKAEPAQFEPKPNSFYLFLQRMST